jgi:hypothetical protein
LGRGLLDREELSEIDEILVDRFLHLGMAAQCFPIGNASRTMMKL